MQTTIRTALQVEECCNHCRRPASRCRRVCEPGETYAGILLRGEWREVPKTDRFPRGGAVAPLPEINRLMILHSQPASSAQ